MAAKYGVPIYRTIHEALTLGGDKDLAVDGVLLIGEHGDYPMNDKDQKLYPRFKMFLEITDAFRRTGRTAPVFNDKHLSFSWRQAKRMVEISQQMGFPMMAGSSVPVAHRRPRARLPLGREGHQGRRDQLQRPRHLRLPPARIAAVHGRAPPGRGDRRPRHPVPRTRCSLEFLEIRRRGRAACSTRRSPTARRSSRATCGRTCPTPLSFASSTTTAWKPPPSC